MFTSVVLHGGNASLLWGYRTAAVLRSWRIAKGDDGKWHLSAAVTRADPFQLRQRPLLFTAPRDKGMWAWSIESIEVTPTSLRAVLGPPEQ